MITKDEDLAMVNFVWEKYWLEQNKDYSKIFDYLNISYREKYNEYPILTSSFVILSKRH